MGGCGFHSRNVARSTRVACAASIRPCHRRLAVPCLVHPIRTSLAAVSVSHYHPFLADRARKTVGDTKPMPLNVAPSTGPIHIILSLLRGVLETPLYEFGL